MKKLPALPVLLLLLPLLCSSCFQNFLSGEDKSEDVKEKEEAALVSLSVRASFQKTGDGHEELLSRGSALPALELDDFTSFSLTGSVTSGDGVAVAESFESKDGMTAYEVLSGASIGVSAGASYDFTLTASVADTRYAGSCSGVLIQPEKNELAFTLSLESPSASGSGSLSVTLSFPASVAMVTASLWDSEGLSVISGYEEESLALSGRSASYQKDNVAAGSYLLLFKLYGADEDGVASPYLYLGSVWEGATVTDGVTSTSSPQISSLDSICTISYVNADGSALASAADGQLTGSYPSSFTRRTESLPLALAEKTGAIFAGWYQSPTDGGSLGTALSGSLSGADLFALATDKKVTLYARWIEPVLYVAADGSDGNDGLTPSLALASLAKAVGIPADGSSCALASLVSDYASLNTVDGVNRAASLDWTVYVSGAVASASSTAIGTLSASSLRIAGLSGLDASGSPQDSLEYTGGSIGTVLSISGSMPITLSNIMLTGANGYNGGAIYNMGQLTLSDGLFISGNDASNGAAVYSAGGCLTIEDGAVISGNTVSASNIYSGGTVYIAGGSLTMTGGLISGNTAASLSGGGLYVASAGSVTISGGLISGNSAAQGGGIYNEGSLTMNGGSVRENTATARGGGLYSSGTLVLSGTALVADDNDVYLPGGKTIAVQAFDGAAAETVATITPEAYVAGTQVLSDGTEGAVAAHYGRFALTQPSGADWIIGSDGCLGEAAGAVDVTIPAWEDLSVSVSVNDVAMSTADSPIRVTAGDRLSFTVASGAASYSWTVDENVASDVDGVSLSTDGSSLVVDTSGWVSGSYDLVLEATCSDGLYSYFATLTVTSP